MYKHPFFWVLPGSFVEKQIISKRGRQTIVNWGCYITGDVQIGQGVIIAPNVVITSSCHGIVRGTYVKDQKTVHKKIVIGDDVFIGAGAIILGGNRIGAGTIIGAGSVLTEDHTIGENEVWAGNPAKFLKLR